jgi:hypothetical protein
MPRRQRFLATRELVRASWACGEREYDGVTRLTEACYSAQELDLPRHFLLPGLSTLARAIDEYGFDRQTFPGGFERDRKARDEIAEANEAWLKSALVAHSFDGGRPVLLGELGIYASLYRDLGIALPARRRLGLFSERADSSQLAGLELVGAHAQDCEGAPLELAREHEGWMVPGTHAVLGAYFAPGPALQIVLLATRAGVLPRTSEESVWHHLALAVGLHREIVDLPDVLELAETLAVREPTCQGLALVRHLFPELGGWAQPDRWGFGSWQLQVPVRIFARRVVAASFR